VRSKIVSLLSVSLSRVSPQKSQKGEEEKVDIQTILLRPHTRIIQPQLSPYTFTHLLPARQAHDAVCSEHAADYGDSSQAELGEDAACDCWVGRHFFFSSSKSLSIFLLISFFLSFFLSFCQIKTILVFANEIEKVFFP
jgi:hypothetical protein